MSGHGTVILLSFGSCVLCVNFVLSRIVITSVRTRGEETGHCSDGLLVYLRFVGSSFFSFSGFQRRAVICNCDAPWISFHCSRISCFTTAFQSDMYISCCIHNNCS